MSMKCPHCNCEVVKDDRFCGECGTKLPDTSAEITSVVGCWLFSGTSNTVTFQENGEVLFDFDKEDLVEGFDDSLGEGEEGIAKELLDVFSEEEEVRGKWEQIGKKLLFDCNGVTLYDVELHGDRMIGTWFHTSGDSKGVHAHTILEREGVDLSNQEMVPPPALNNLDDGSYDALIYKGFKQVFLADEEGLTTFDDTKMLFAQAVKIDPDRPEAYVGLGMCYFYLGDYEAALPHIEQAVNNNFGYDARYESIRFEHVPDGGYPDDLLVYELDIGAVIMYRAMIHFNLGDIDLAERDLDGVFDNIPEEYTADKYLLRAGICIERDELENSWRHVEKALTFDPDSADAHYMRGQLYFENEDVEAAIKSFSHAINLDPRHPDALLARAESFSAIGATKEMKADIKSIRSMIKAGYCDAEILEQLDEVFDK